MTQPCDQPWLPCDFLFGSWQVPRAHRFLQLLQRRHVSRQGLAIGQLRRAITAFRVKEIQQAGRPALVGILADVARILRLLEVSGRVKLYDFIVALDALRTRSPRPT